MHFRALTVGMAACVALAGCGDRNFTPQEDTLSPGALGRQPELRRQNQDSLFGEDGLAFGSGDNTITNLLNDQEEEAPGGIPVNRFLWRASLDTLSFLPLASTDPFTGVIATDWGATAEAPGERFKVTAYMVDGRLSASSLRVAVFREVQGEEGQWLPAAVDPSTPRRIEDAILTRARQIRLAESGVDNTG
ncbi:MAG: DUF3576 domain-containing protein [Pseudomonadota bacterium]